MSEEEERVRINLRIKSKTSQAGLLRDVDTKQKIKEFLGTLGTMTGVPPEQITLLKGYPPRRVEFDSEALLESLGLSNQDTLIVEEDRTLGAGTGVKGVESKTGPVGADSAKNQMIINALTSVREDSGPPVRGEVVPPGLMMRQVVPSDNSCLFTSIMFCLSDLVEEDGRREGPDYLRGIIASTVASKPEEYTEGYLGKPNPEYVQWILKNESWGGGIELAIMSDFYGIEIAVINIQSGSMSRFGEDKLFGKRIFLLYDGIHYDPLFLETFDGGKDWTVFPTDDLDVVEKAVELGREAKAAHQYTDVANFSLRCNICNAPLKGQTEAQAHAKQTGHTAFAEILK